MSASLRERHRNGATFVATRLREYNGVVYALSCVCWQCRHSELLCDHIVSFIREQPNYVGFVLLSRAAGLGDQ